MTPHHIYKYSWIDEKKRGNMSGTYPLKQDHDEAGQYEIRVHGHLANHWTGWFEGLDFTQEENGDTLITGTLVDQAALFGLLRKVRDVGLPLISVNRVAAGQADRSDDKS
jgi:hypothetical protein